ncbi:MAG: deoxyribonuclease IV [Armatimonadota bacterium]
MLINKGFSSVPDAAQKLGCNTIQIFSKNPRGWDSKELKKDDVDLFKSKMEKFNIAPLIIHTSYLLSLSSSNKDVFVKSSYSLIDEMERAKILGAEFLVTHIRGDGKVQIIEGIDWALGKVADPPILLLEGVPSLGRDIFKLLGEIIKGSKYKRHLGICFDTCHIYTAGFDLSKKSGIDEVKKQIKKHVGLNRLYVMHLNDSKSPLGSKIDRHEHIGKGHIGLKGFSYLLNDSYFSKVPMIIETPKKTPQDDKKNLKVLRSLIKN